MLIERIFHSGCGEYAGWPDVEDRKRVEPIEDQYLRRSNADLDSRGGSGWGVRQES